MANANAPNGFTPVRHLTGGEIRQSVYSIASTYNTALGTGDVVQLTGTGRNIEASEAGNVDNIGVFAGCSYVNAAGERVFSPYWTAGTTGTDIKAFVWDDPAIVFECQSGSCAEGDVSAMADHVTGTPSASTGQSTAYLNATTATTGKSFHILRLAPKVNNAYGTYARVEVTFGEHNLANVISGTGGV